MKHADAAAACLAAALLFGLSGEAHKGITSKFTYNADVYPVFLKRCSRCHVDGGVGPMSLLKYEDAFPWAESLRAELLAASAEADLSRRSSAGAEADPSRRSSAGAEAEDFVKAAHRQISARELDVVLDWATGGTPEGDPANAPLPAALEHDWARAKPDLVISLAEPFQIPADSMETTQEFLLPVPVTQPRNAGALDVLPGNPAVVRTVTISLKPKDGQARVLGTWFPRQTPVPLALKPPARLEPGAEIVARVRYKKTWKFEGQAMTDRSAVGFYFDD